MPKPPILIGGFTESQEDYMNVSYYDVSTSVRDVNTLYKRLMNACCMALVLLIQIRVKLFL